MLLIKTEFHYNYYTVSKVINGGEVHDQDYFVLPRA